MSCPTCHAPLLNGQRFGHCGACHRTFMGVTAFDKHRRGPWIARVCINPATDTALTENGNPVAVWWQDDHGRWHEGARDPRFEKETDR